MSQIVQVEVDCPQCGNVNREARRQCRRGGMCQGTGKVMKTAPAQPGTPPPAP